MSIETILAEHVLLPDFANPDGYRCSCGETGMSTPPGTGHRAHLADLIRTELSGDEVVEAVAWVLHESRCDEECPVDGGDEADARAALAAAVTALGGEL